VEPLEQPDEREDEEDDREELEPFVREHPGQPVIWANVNLGAVLGEVNLEVSVVWRGADRGADGTFNLFHVPAVKFLGIDKLLE